MTTNSSAGTRVATLSYDSSAVVPEVIAAYRKDSRMGDASDDEVLDELRPNYETVQNVVTLVSSSTAVWGGPTVDAWMTRDDGGYVLGWMIAVMVSPGITLAQHMDADCLSYLFMHRGPAGDTAADIQGLFDRIAYYAETAVRDFETLRAGTAAS